MQGLPGALHSPFIDFEQEEHVSKTRDRGGPRRAAGATPSPRGSNVVIRLNQRVLMAGLVGLAVVVALLIGIVVGAQSGGSRVPAVANPPAGQVNPEVAGSSQGSVVQLDASGQAQSVPQGLAVATRVAPAGGLDPNIADFALADPDGPIGDVPRLTVSDLDRELTYNFGIIQGNQPVEHTFIVKNTGKVNLLIGQVFASCGCTIPRFANVQMNEEGLIIPPLDLAPGATAELVVQYDPAARPEDVGPIYKYIQIFSNDPKGKPVGNDPTGVSRELRFRITGNVVR